jgi:hypothetical protein
MVGCGWNGSAHSPSELLEPPFVVGLESADRFPRVAHAIPRIVLHLLPGKPPRSSSCSPGHRLQSLQATMRFLNHVPRRGLVVPLRSPMMLVNVPRPPRESPPVMRRHRFSGTQHTYLQQFHRQHLVNRYSRQRNSRVRDRSQLFQPRNVHNVQCREQDRLDRLAS